jgi:hypothetical protein
MRGQLSGKYGLDPVPDLDSEPEPKPEPKLFLSRSRNRKKSLRFHNTELMMITFVGDTDSKLKIITTSVSTTLVSDQQCQRTPYTVKSVNSYPAVLRIRIRDPVPFCPLDPGSGIRNRFFRIPDPKPILLRA